MRERRVVVDRRERGNETRELGANERDDGGTVERREPGIASAFGRRFDGVDASPDVDSSSDDGSERVSSNLTRGGGRHVREDHDASRHLERGEHRRAVRDEIAFADFGAIARERRRRLHRLAEERVWNAVRGGAFDRGVRLERAFHLAAKDVLAADDDDVLDAIDDAEPPVRVHRRRVARAEPTPRREFRRRRGSRRRVPVPVEQRRAANDNLTDLLTVVRDGDERRVGRGFVRRRRRILVARLGPSRDEHLDRGVVVGGDASRARQEFCPVLDGRAPRDGFFEGAEKAGAHAPAHLGHAVVDEKGRVWSRGEKFANQCRRHVRPARRDEPKRRERKQRR